jgi:hypothetical protein
MLAVLLWPVWLASDTGSSPHASAFRAMQLTRRLKIAQKSAGALLSWELTSG